MRLGYLKKDHDFYPEYFLGLLSCQVVRQSCGGRPASDRFSIGETSDKTKVLIGNLTVTLGEI